MLGAKYFGFEFANRIDSKAVVNTWDVTSPPHAAKTSRSDSSFSTNGGVTATAMSHSGRGVAPEKRNTSMSSHNSPPQTGGSTPSDAISADRSSSSIDAGDSPGFVEKDGAARVSDEVSWEETILKGVEGLGGGGDGAEVTRNSYEVRVRFDRDPSNHCVSYGGIWLRRGCTASISSAGIVVQNVLCSSSIGIKAHAVYCGRLRLYPK